MITFLVTVLALLMTRIQTKMIQVIQFYKCWSHDNPVDSDSHESIDY